MIARVKYRALQQRELRASQVMAVSRSGTKINGSDPPLPAVCPANSRTSLGAGSGYRGTATPPGRDLQRPAVPHGAPCPWPNFQPGVGTDQDRPRMVRQALGRPDGNPPGFGTAPTRLASRAACAASAGSISASGWRGVVSRLPTLTRAATRLVKKDDHLRPAEKAHRGRGDFGADPAQQATGEVIPKWLSSGSGPAMKLANICGVVIESTTKRPATVRRCAERHGSHTTCGQTEA
jgi:hypothetical protein